MRSSEPLTCDLTVIGMGMAGMASALFAANRGLSTVQIGVTGEMIFATGLMDLMGVHPVEEGKCWRDPWAGIGALTRDIPMHPYARVRIEDIKAAFEELLSFLSESGLPYLNGDERNSEIMTPLGTIKQTYCVPKSMWGGVEVIANKRPCLIVGFEGLSEFSAHQIAATLGEQWGALRAISIPFPGDEYMRGLSAGEMMAQSLELSRNRERLAQAILPHLKDAQAVGVPAVLGMHRTDEIVAELQTRVGVTVFEIPTMPVSVPGLRLNDAFYRELPLRGVKHFAQERVLEVRRDHGLDFLLSVGNKEVQHIVRTRGIILASGRFWGRGLYADRKRVREAIFDLPVYQPKDRAEWHRLDFLDPRGHPINEAGLDVDDMFRPLGDSGRAAYDTLFCAGSILAHQDWMRMKCGSGLAIATAYGAVNGFLRSRA
jgi:glycerol-3-phosphate dehydrogenase subunit B